MAKVRDEIDDVLILYHGGRVPHHAGFWPISHFGTRQAAIDRITRNFEDSIPEANVLYRCSVKLCPKTIADLPDWHAATQSGLILALHKANKLDLPDFDRRRLMSRLNEIERADPRAARREAVEAIAHLGISAFRYPNQHEGRIGEFSYCIVDPRAVKIIDQTEIADPRKHPQACP